MSREEYVKLLIDEMGQDMDCNDFEILRLQGNINLFCKPLTVEDDFDF